MAWYYILFFSVFIFFILKTIISLIFGDADVDFDSDGDIDFDISSMLSFKGILHFLFGFSSYLAATARFDRTYNNIGTYQFTWDNYVVAFIIGLAFMYGLWHLYKFMGKLNHYNLNNLDVNGYNATILINNGFLEYSENGDKIYSYTVLVNTEGGSQKITVLSLTENLPIGSTHKIYKNIKGVCFI